MSLATKAWVLAAANELCLKKHPRFYWLDAAACGDCLKEIIEAATSQSSETVVRTPTQAATE